jgi:electron-transferring-flavoprotein dehydrogenase
MDREIMSYDVVIVGGGVAGLSCAIRLKQLDVNLSVCVLEKGAQIGAHSLSGAVFEPRSLNELFPDWQERGAPLQTQATHDSFYYLNSQKAWRLPTPPQMHNQGNYIVSMGEVNQWLATQAESLGVEIYAGFAAHEILLNDHNRVIGVATNDMGIGKNGERTAHYESGVAITARQTIIAEGCHGSLSKRLMVHYDLRRDCDPQTYGLGIKEIWEVRPEHHQKGHITHTLGWPMDTQTYGGGWMYHYGENLVSIGFVVGLDYQNPYLSPFQEMQRFKTHPHFKKILQSGRRIAYGARALCEGGLHSLPKLGFAGGLLIGDAAGFLNVAKIKGNHTAMKSAMLAAEALIPFLHSDQDAVQGSICEAYQSSFEKSWLWEELYASRNIRAGFQKGLWYGLWNAALETLTKGKRTHHIKNHADHTSLKLKTDCTPIEYPAPDHILTFDRLSSVHLSNTYHEEDQPVHLRLKDPNIPVQVNLAQYDEPAQRYCPAAVYEIVTDVTGQPALQINAQNCIHCKTCDIKDPSQNIDWTVPQGGGGPNYSGM